MATSFVRFVIAASIFMAQHQLTMCLSADDFIVIAEGIYDDVVVANMSYTPFFGPALTFTPSLSLRRPNRVDFDCVDHKIYVTDSVSTINGGGFVARFNRDGSAAEELNSGLSGPRRPHALYVDEPNRRFFWTGHGDTGGGVFVTDMAGTTTRTILTTAETSYYLENIALDEKKEVLYITDSDRSRSGIYAVNITDSSEFTKIFSDPDKDDITGLVVDGEKLYWSDADSKCIGFVSKNGSSSVILEHDIRPAPQAFDMAFYYNNLYYVDRSDGVLQRVPKDFSSQPVAVSHGYDFSGPYGLHIEFSPPCITDTLDLTVVSANEIALSWTPDNSICYDKCEADEYQVSFQSYDVQTCSLSDSSVYNTPWRSASLATLNSLASDTYYQMKVTSRNLPADDQLPYEGNSVYIVEPCIASDLKVEQIPSNNLSVSWNTTECECRADEFQVSYTAMDYCNVETSGMLPWQTSTSAILPVRSSLSRVDVTVSYRKMYGETSTEGRLPITKTVRNITSAPTGPPSKVTVLSVGANDLIMTWSDVPCEKEVMEYQYELQTSYGIITGTTSPTSSIVAFSDLKCGTEYSFRVKAITMEGMGPFSEYFVVQTLMSREPFASGISVFPVLGGNEVSWESAECSPASLDVKYTLIRRDQCEDVHLSTNLPPVSGSGVILETLLPFSTYIIEVTGMGSSGASVTRSIPIVTHESAPSAPPVGLQVLNIKASKLIFSWRPPPCGSRHGKIVNYQYEYRRRYQSIYEIGTTSFTSVKEAVKLEGLNSNTDYEFRVAAMTSAGIGPFSNAVWVKTDDQCPLDYCLNGGTCYFNELSGEPSCSCISGYFGIRCDMSVAFPSAETTPILSAESDDGLAPGGILAVATSVGIGILMTSVAVVVFFYFVCSRGNRAGNLTRAPPAANFGLSDIGGGGNWILQ